ncbi:hypothetical protein EVAR_95740_1 [Eumeta japonica]|uniref:Uncharacterized protein n=1 Tax=Eumeta variegata TaxID=151549 RepID=A0A4C1UM62_EUMVA|nr:hypothetical protein EVAR_95740_1 [Eumeta japonica]
MNDVCTDREFEVHSLGDDTRCERTRLARRRRVVTPALIETRLRLTESRPSVPCTSIRVAEILMLISVRHRDFSVRRRIGPRGSASVRINLYSGSFRISSSNDLNVGSRALEDDESMDEFCIARL